MREDNIGHAAHILVEQLAQHFRCGGFHQRGEPGNVGEDGRDLAPLHLHAVTFADDSQPGGDLRRKISRKRRMRPLGLKLAAASLAHHLDVADGLVDGHFEIAEIDRLGQKIERTSIHRSTDVAHVAIGGNDNGPLPVLRFLQLLQQGEAVHPRHVDVGNHHVDMRMIHDRLQRLDSIMGEYERHRAIANFPAEFLQNQGLEIGLVIDNEDGCSHAACPRRVSISRRNSAKSIGLVNRPSAPRSIALRRVSASP